MGSFLPFPSDNYEGYPSLFQSSHYEGMEPMPSFKAIEKAWNDFNAEEKLPSQGYTLRGWRRSAMQSEAAHSYLGKRKLDDTRTFSKHSQSDSRGGGGVTPREEADAEVEEKEEEEHIWPFLLSKSSSTKNKFPALMRGGRNDIGRVADNMESKSSYCGEPRNFNFVRHIFTPSAAAMAIIGTTAKHLQGGKCEGRRGGRVGLFGSWPSPPPYPHPQQEMSKDTAIEASQHKKSIGFTLPPTTMENSKVEP